MLLSLNMFTFLIILGIVGGIISLTATIVILITEKETDFLEVEKKRAELEVLLNESRFLHLSSQIQPHFLFNTLNIISTLIRLNKVREAEQAIYSVASLLRYQLKNGEPLVSLEEELDYVRNYLTIQNLRFGSRLDWNINIPQELLSKQIPLLTVQPLVENACIHGIEPSVEGGTITLSTEYVNKTLLIKVYDNGIGVNEQVVSEFENWKRSGKNEKVLLHIGIRNVHSRLFQQFGYESGLTINKLAQGTICQIKICYEGD